ncbi:MAG: PIG-L family deacetylase [Bacteroidia bacterium]|nr:PIG-L family deacetylase [Bacteroidia bacterium]
MRQLLVLSFFLASTAVSQILPSGNDPSMYKVGYDIPAGVEHGTWDFDEWPGVDHKVVYTKNFMYGDANEKVKIDYNLSVFEKTDHTGYLRTPAELSSRFTSMNAALSGHRSIIGIFTHPDDEILLAGGLFAWAAERGMNAKIYLVSNGADGSKGFTDAPASELGGYNCFGIMPDGKVRVATDRMGREKERILRAYAKRLGVSVEILPVALQLDGKNIVQVGEFAGLDFKKTFAPGSDARKAIERSIVEMLQRERPEVVVTHGSGGEYANYLHKTVHQIVKTSVISLKSLLRCKLFTGFPEYNYDDRITHFLDLRDGTQAWQKKHDAFKGLEFVYQPGNDYDKPWNPNDALMDGVFVKDYGYTPIEGKPPRYEFFQLLDAGN